MRLYWQRVLRKNLLKEWASSIAAVFGKGKKDSLEIEQLAHISPAEQESTLALAKLLATEDRAPTDAELKLLKSDQTAVDIALFGRMLASSPAFDVEAACRVAQCNQRTQCCGTR